jgi:hypothetical protein
MRKLPMRKLPSSPLIALLFACAACGGGPPYAAKEKSPGRTATADTTVLLVLDDEVKWQLELLDHAEETLSDGRLRARVRLANRSPADLHLQVAWTFKDARGLATEPDSPFEHLFVGAGQTLELARDSLVPGAVAYHVQAKTAHTAK